MTEDVYRILQERLNAYSIGFPATESGVEIEILKRLFTEEEAALFLELSPLLEAPDSIAGRLDRPTAEMADKLEDMASRGLLFRLRKGDSVKYGAIPFMHGLLEFRVTRLDRDLVELFERYYDERFKEAIIESSDTFLRTVPVNEAIEFSQQVAPFDDACAILRNAKLIVVADCICRKERGMVGEACDKPLETCFMFGSMAQYYIDNDLGRPVDTDEAINILKEAQDAGLVTQPATSQNPSGMCNCCGDCCGILRSVNLMERPSEYVFSNHYAVVDREFCSGCEICIDRCQMRALRMNESSIVEVDLDRCIGCGLCVTTCPTEALQLVRKEEEAYRTPPPTSMEQMLAMARKRGVRF